MRRAKVALAERKSRMGRVAWMVFLAVPVAFVSITGFPCMLPIGLLFAFACLVRLAEVFWLEPRARELAITDEGFIDPARGTLVRWEDVVSVERRFVRFAWTLADGRTFEAPRSLFADPARDESILRARCRTGGVGPYRAAG